MPSKKKTANEIEAEGDLLALKGNYKKALKKYRAAAASDPKHSAIYDKLSQTLEKAKGNWKIDDFVESVSWAMKKQELCEPKIRLLHAKLAPEWKRANELAFKIMTATENETTKLTEELVAMGEVGTRALIEILREIKKSPYPRGQT